MNITVEMKPEIGPWLPNPIRTAKDLERVEVPDTKEALGYVMDAIRLTNKKLDRSVPLIGFAGAPWTIFCYAVQGQGSKNFDAAKALCFTEPKLAHALLDKITETTIDYLLNKVRAGVDAIQVFDSWGGMLSPEDYNEFSWPYLQQIIRALEPHTKVIVFAKGCWYALEKMSTSGASALGIDWTCSPEFARKATANAITLQGNFDPSRLLSPPEDVYRMVQQMIRRFGKDRYVVNLGHGILPTIPLENVAAFIAAVKEFEEV
ncbi:MAG: uroporphyrinogen decarboxylase family protein, partial [Flavobacteriaceae bacterium]|nr:uroporphyrinogen decarboxylase family protein [Flavobacteriaceae bacterium]